ncbi:mitochondrial 2-oxodicarboxylate carrier isoform X2 [Condylostylus longicornis]|nr:mitochondrial 2-oxodicarboxylate carrier isoform X2 [Condylostylus longicornis]XP_055377543.1 mitochondrial 2-oxodicarboxylate carrier isoform X2 [Condylostylus longicornis]XP_055377630.1 mitochondrial 2-oxodicarboxylate carrier isoform X2 [Condylostylus longicornis]
MPSDNAKETTGLKRACFQILAGGSAGFVEVSIMQPLDVVKTRLQLQNKIVTKSKTELYTGVFDCFKKMYKNEGVFSFWKGIIPPIMAETPKRALKFVCFEQLKPLLMFGHEKPTPLTFSLAGLGAGVTEAVAVNPFEVVKVTQQADKAHARKAANTFTVTKRIINENGFGSKGLNKGLTATMSRNGAFNMVYFGFYNSVKDMYSVNPDPTLEFLKKFCIGFVSGTLASLFNIPFDVAKSRIQGPQPDPNKIKYKGTINSILIVYKEEGLAALYKGLVPKVMRLGPGGAIMMLVFEHVFEYLQDNF